MYVPIIIWNFVIIIFQHVSTVEASVGAVKTGTTWGGVAKELADLAVYGSTRAIIVRNYGNAWLRIWCASKDDDIGEKHLNPGESLSFAFKPMVVGGGTTFWCTLDYKYYWARWDAFGDHAPYGRNNLNDRAYIYEVRDDGVYYNGRKIRGLLAGQHKYKLWDHYDGNKRPHGTSLEGFVDGGMCNNIPGFMEWQTSSVTVCDISCVILYSDLHCHGETSRLQAPSQGCNDFWLSYFNDRARSVKGC